MQLYVKEYNTRAFTQVGVSHPDEEELIFDGGGYRTTRMLQRKDGNTDDSLFKEANEFILLLPEKDQNALFEIYARLESYFSEFDYEDIESEKLTVAEYLSAVTKDIFKIVKYDDLLDYVRGNTALKIPADVHPTYTTDDKITQSYTDKTYCIKDYLELQAFSLGQRFMIPIWGPYSKILETTAGRMKDYMAFCLLQNTCMWESEAFERACIYIEANIDQTMKNLSAMLNFLAKEEIPAYLLALASLRKLSISPLSCGPNEDAHLMRILHGYATNQHKSLDKNIQPDVHDKENNHEFADDNTSVFGMFKMKEQISIGDLEIIQTYIGRYQSAARRIEPTVIDAHVEACVQAAVGLKGYRPSETQKGLAAWVASYIVPGVTIPLLDRKHLMTVMGITQAVLWAWKYYELAILLTAKPVPRDFNEHRSRAGRAHLSKELMEQLEVVYPMTFPVNNYVPGGESTNIGVRGIETIVLEFNKEEWEPTCPRALAKLHANSNISRRIDPSYNLRDQLAELLIRLDAQI